MRERFGKAFGKTVVYLILIMGAAFILLPFVWMLLTSIKPSKEV